ncbi:hypothetical protein GCM10027589_40530 [Actinocorallia lasiicapitis]
MKRRVLALMMVVLMAATTGCSVLRKPAWQNDQNIPYDVSGLVHPKKKFFGTAVEEVLTGDKAIAQFTRDAARKPNMVAMYVQFEDLLDEKFLQRIWKGGAVPLIVWEPMKQPVSEVAAGKYDAFIKSWAVAIRKLNMPVAISWAHEFNGDWYPWGHCFKERPKSIACKSGRSPTKQQYIDSFRKVRQGFNAEGATNVLWIWSPNINDGRDIDLGDYWPGPQYVDWLGPIGYFEWKGADTALKFGEIFDLTIRQMRKFTAKPILIPETGGPASKNKPAEIGDLWFSVRTRKDVVGAIWFHIKKIENGQVKDWRFNSDPGSEAAYREAGKHPMLNLDPRNPV